MFSTARDLVYWRAVRLAGGMPSHRQVLVLCYHAVADLSGDPIMSQYGIEPADFARQLDSLRSRGFTFIGGDELEQLLDGKAGVPRRAALLTFDDCYEELVDVARDILQPRGIPAIAFAVTGMKSNSNEWDQRIGARKLRLLDPNGLRELSDRGVEIGCHSKSHTPLTKVQDRDLAEETAGSAAELLSLGLPQPRYFAYPHGDHDERARAAVRKAGFVAGFGLKPALASPDSDRFALPRIEILARDSGWRFELKTRWMPSSRLIQPDPIHVRARRLIGRGLRRFGIHRTRRAGDEGNDHRQG
jgi:peptidoglycan/xylan/chitin deacetylase (PgdA/CDA1 family)